MFVFKYRKLAVAWGIKIHYQENCVFNQVILHMISTKEIMANNNMGKQCNISVLWLVQMFIGLNQGLFIQVHFTTSLSLELGLLMSLPSHLQIEQYDVHLFILCDRTLILNPFLPAL